MAMHPVGGGAPRSNSGLSKLRVDGNKILSAMVIGSALSHGAGVGTQPDNPNNRIERTAMLDKFSSNVSLVFANASRYLIEYGFLVNHSFSITHMNYSSLALLALAILLLKFFQKLLSARQRQLLPFAPGPSPQPLVGNFRDLPTKLPWLTYSKWGLQYGSDLVHASALGQHVVVVNSVKTAVELFEKRSHIYSDRPVIAMVKLMGWDFNLGLLPLGDRWRVQRRMFQQHFRRDVSRNYRPVQIKKVHQLLRGLLSSPHEFRELIKTLAAATIMSIIYGYEVKPSNDRFVALSENAVKKLLESVFPGAIAVNTFPILRYLPSWMPGTGFKRFAAEDQLPVA
ncbi:cytochrome P450 [Mycena galopus ATCC 62051]|nr:cytochrome P450 [Mycena galopus ATCC 62051]